MAEPEFDEKVKKINLKWIALFFVIALSFIAYGAITNTLPLTGNLVKPTNETNSIAINADIGIPSLGTKGVYEKITLSDPRDTVFYVGGTRFELTNQQKNEVVIENFEGKIEFDQEQLLILDGKVTKITINTVPILPESDTTTKIRMGNPTSFESLSITDTFFIDKLEYTTSGTLGLVNSKDILVLENEEIMLKEFQGSASISEGSLKLNGFLNELEIRSDPLISIKA